MIPRRDVVSRDIYQELSVSKWFRESSRDKKMDYVVQFKALFDDPIYVPTVKDLMDTHFETSVLKILVHERTRISQMDKVTPIYDEACKKFVRKVEYYKELQRRNTGKNIRETETQLLANPKFSEPVKDRILTCLHSSDIKAILYDKYLTMMSSSGDDAVKYQDWIDTVLELPTESRKFKLDSNLPHTEAVGALLTKIKNKLDEKIYGMETAKEELICMMTNMLMNPKSKFKAIGLKGPPGIGKTMMAYVLAEVLEIPIEIISLGGITDSSFLEGHSFTYIGSQPGCIVKAITRMKCTNGIIYFDELDKISKTNWGKEIEHALLHITDFTQNHNFRDKYIPEIPIDISNCIFLYSMNQINELDTALVSRIPVLHFQGYTLQEKITIIKNFLLPEILKEYSLKEYSLKEYSLTVLDITIDTPTSEYLIKNIKEEDEDIVSGKSGVRGLKKMLNKIVSRINIYRTVSVNGSLPFNLTFKIDKFSLPFSINKNLIDQIIASSAEKVTQTHSYYM